MKPSDNFCFHRYLPLVLVAGISFAPCTTASARLSQQNQSRREVQDTNVTLNRHKHDLARPQEWKTFLQTLKTLREQAKADKTEKKEAKKEKKAEKKERKRDEENGEGNTQVAAPKTEQQDAEQGKTEAAEKPKLRKGERDWSSKKVRRGLNALDHVAQQVQAGKLDKAEGIHTIQEISWAVESTFIPPSVWRSSIDLGDFLFRTRHLMLNPCGRGSAKNPAANLRSYEASDLSRVDPLPSPFWTPPGNIAAKNLYAGFDRPALPDYANTICDYDSPHGGYGVHPSFEVVQNDHHWKVKFGNERSTEPFACRIFSALGFPVEITDYAPLVKVHWDRRILTEFNSRKVNSVHLKLAGIPLLTTHPNPYSNPFDYIRYAVLKDSSQVEARNLRELLLPETQKHSHAKRPELKTSLYDAEFEQKIDYLVMQAASFRPKEDDDKEIGAWDYNVLENPGRRELRGMAVLDAWLENYDVRWGNNQMLLTEDADTVRCVPIVSDLGGIFGQSAGMIRARPGGVAFGLYGDAPNEYGWTCTHSQVANASTVPIQDYMPINKIQPFYEMNLDDARWMARLIAQFTEPQLKAALIASGYDAPVARILLEKLVSRRDCMIQDFGLSGEIAPLRPNGVNKKLSYDAQTDGPIETTLADGRKVAAQDSGEVRLVNGLLKPNLPMRHK